MNTSIPYKTNRRFCSYGYTNMLWVWGVFFLLMASCREAYEPPAIKANYNYLVVDGVINATPNGKTTITLSRTRNLIDTTITSPETDAAVSIEAQTGGAYPLSAAGDGTYSNAGPVPLTIGAQYRLKIVTQNGTEYASDFVPAKETPPIDSVSWQQEGSVTISVNTHDPQNQARYYRWDYAETWEYFSPLRGSIYDHNGLIYYFDSTNRIDQCWITKPSTNIAISNSLKLSQDKIDHFPIAFIPQNSEKIGVRYSILVNQYTVTEDGYNYLEILEKNTQQVGSLFDPQPSQLRGNIHCITNPSEPVIGFLSASTIQSKRIFILKSEVSNWLVPLYEYDCTTVTIGQDPVNYLNYSFPNAEYGPYYFVTGGLILARRICLDCNLRGGISKRPSFW